MDIAFSAVEVWNNNIWVSQSHLKVEFGIELKHVIANNCELI